MFSPKQPLQTVASINSTSATFKTFVAKKKNSLNTGLI